MPDGRRPFGVSGWMAGTSAYTAEGVAPAAGDQEKIDKSAALIYDLER